MSGAAVRPALIGAIIAFAGAGIARGGWRGLRLAAAPLPAAWSGAPTSGRSAGWKLFHLAVLLLGGFVFVCGLLLAASPFLSE